MLVNKFGGTSLGDAKRFAEVARIVAEQQDQQPVVVVSAMSGTTNALIDGARAAEEGNRGQYAHVVRGLFARHQKVIDALLQDSAERTEIGGQIEEHLEGYRRLCDSIATLGELTMRGHDAVASIGEQLSSRILAAVLRQRGINAVAVSATELICTDNKYGSASPDMIETRQQSRAVLLPLVESGQVPVVTGYIGATPSGTTTTLGRGGSDYSAAVLGVVLEAQEVWIWTDVNGILTADPKLVPQAHTLPELSYEEAEELAYFGADVLHPKTLLPLAQRNIPLRILNSFVPSHPGTRISDEPSPSRDVMPAIISSDGLCLIEIASNGRGWSLDMASRALSCLAMAGAEVVMFSQSFSERSLNLVVRQRDQAHSMHALKQEFARELQLSLISEIRTQERVAALSIIGMPDEEEDPIPQRAFAALGKLGTRVISVAQAASAYSVSFIVPEKELRRTVPRIHQELGL